jgi:hypothetical protein
MHKSVVVSFRVLAIAGLFAAMSSCGGGGGGGGVAPVPSPGPSPPPPPVVSGPAWPSFGRDAQHSAVSAIATQDLNRIAWSTAVDLAPQYTTSGALLVHYGSPVISDHDTVVVPVKTGANAGFRVEGHDGTSGALVWSQDSDYAVPPHRWMPSYNATLMPDGRVAVPMAGGRVLVRDSADAATSATHTFTFYGDAAYNAAPAIYNANVFINTPITVDAQGNLYFGFAVTGATAANLAGGIARIDASGNGKWVSAAAATGVATMNKAAMNSAPALSSDAATVYAAVNTAPSATQNQTGYLLALDSGTLATKAKAALTDPATQAPAWVSDDGTASPTVGPDGHVYFGVLESNFGSHNGRGWMLQFDANLSQQFVPGAFGWDVTASLVPASLVPSYTGTSPRLLAVKYNNYEGVGTGDGRNKLAILDPGTSQTDPISGLPVMREVLAVLGPTFISGGSGPVYEWCINTMAVDPFTKSIIANSEDGILYRWDLTTNTFTQKIRITNGLGEAYTPTAIGPDGTVYAIGNAKLFAVTR